MISTKGWPISIKKESEGKQQHHYMSGRGQPAAGSRSCLSTPHPPLSRDVDLFAGECDALSGISLLSFRIPTGLVIGRCLYWLLLYVGIKKWRSDYVCCHLSCSKRDWGQAPKVGASTKEGLSCSVFLLQEIPLSSPETGYSFESISFQIPCQVLGYKSRWNCSLRVSFRTLAQMDL